MTSRQREREIERGRQQWQAVANTNIEMRSKPCQYLAKKKKQQRNEMKRCKLCDVAALQWSAATLLGCVKCALSLVNVLPKKRNRDSNSKEKTQGDVVALQWSAATLPACTVRCMPCKLANYRHLKYGLPELHFLPACPALSQQERALYALWPFP